MSRDLLVARVGRIHIAVSTTRWFIEIGWIRIPGLIKSFGWTFLWIRGMR